MLAPRSCQTSGVSDLASARLYMVCEERPDAFLAAALRGGVDIVQLRIKDRSDRAIVDAGRRFAATCAELGALFILNDRPDLVESCRADGVHVGQDDVAVAEARALVGPSRIVGLSTHSPEQVDEAGAQDVNYIGVGPVHATPTKPGRLPVGLELVRYAAEHASVPFFAIGGINAGNVGAVREAGARRIAVVRALTEAPDPEQTARRLRAAISSEARVGSA
jgi:thiamine-phosphate pyrophosphorylase